MSVFPGLPFTGGTPICICNVRGGGLQCRGVPLIWLIVGQEPTALAVGAGGGCLDVFSLVCHI